MIEIFYAVVMAVLCILYLSWIVIFVAPTGRHRASPDYKDISIIIPAHNEEGNIRRTIESVLGADYPRKREIIVVDDGSRDKTASIVRSMTKQHGNIRLVHTNHVGKGKAVDAGAKISRDFFAVLDADTEIEKDALLKLFRPFSDGKVGAVSTTLNVRPSKNPLNWFQQLEYTTSSSWRYVVDKIGGSCIVPGFCAFRKAAFFAAGGFRGESCVEDYDICMYLKKSGYKIEMAEDTFAFTTVPETVSGLFRQRVRWSRGTLQVINKHRDILLKGPVGAYSMPTQLYWFIHAMLYVPLVIYQISSGYITYFVSQGSALTIGAILYFLKWITFYGMMEFIYFFATGAYPANLPNIATIIVFTLSYSFMILSLLKFSRRTTKEMIFAIFFFFPYAMGILITNIYSIFYEFFSKTRGEKWEKEL